MYRLYHIIIHVYIYIYVYMHICIYKYVYLGTSRLRCRSARGGHSNLIERRRGLGMLLLLGVQGCGFQDGGFSKYYLQKA